MAVRERGRWEEEGSHEFVGDAKTGHKASTTEAWLLALQDPASLDDERQWVMGDNVSHQ